MPVVLVPTLIVLDQVLKLWAERYLSPVPTPFLPGLYLTYVKNTGAAFGLFQGNSELLGWASLAVGLALLLYLWIAGQRVSLAGQLALSFVATGALGNAIDRVGRGYVIDYLDIGPGLWPVFNLADSLVVVGVLVLVLIGAFGRRRG